MAPLGLPEDTVQLILKIGLRELEPVLGRIHTDLREKKLGVLDAKVKGSGEELDIKLRNALAERLEEFHGKVNMLFATSAPATVQGDNIDNAKLTVSGQVSAVGSTATPHTGLLLPRRAWPTSTCIDCLCARQRQ